MMKYSDRPNTYINVKDLEIAIVKTTSYGDALDAVREAPSIDICFCEECIYADKKPIADGRYWCNIHRCYMRFCSDGEREGE